MNETGANGKRNGFDFSQAEISDPQGRPPLSKQIADGGLASNIAPPTGEPAVERDKDLLKSENASAADAGVTGAATSSDNLAETSTRADAPTVSAPESADFTQGKIARVKELLAEAQAEDAAAEDKRALSYQHDLRARRKRIEAGRLMLELEQGGMPRMRIYKEIGISAKEGRHLWSLASFYSGIDAAGLDRREQAGGLMSKNQAEALEKYVPLLNDDEAERLIKKVRDDSQLNDPEFGPDNIAWIARNRTKEEDNLRNRLEIAQETISALKNDEKTTKPPLYDARFNGDEITVNAPTLLLVFAALTKNADTAVKSLDFFAGANEFVIRRISRHGK